MPKKSNKTSHVLNMITNRTGLTPDEIEDSIPKPQPESPNGRQTEEGLPKNAAEDISEQIRINLERVEALDLEARATAVRLKIRERAKMIEERLSGYDNHTVVAIKHDRAQSAKVEAFDPESFGPDSFEPASFEPEPAEEREKSSREFVDSGKAMDGFVLTNILEEVVRLEAPKIMSGYGMCCCERCTNDVIAVTLNNIPSKYVVSLKGSLFAKITSYGMQYRTDIYSKLAEACAKVSKSPSHS
ncbi:MAG: late competence development ComFB family protein [Clostridiales bacterium]|nr:late competence development ComFB family protein [Clostridiales bacterium]